jgi:hypothetical protein
MISNGMQCCPANTLSIRPIYLSVVEVGTVHPPAEILVEWCWLAKDYPLATPRRFGAAGRWSALGPGRVKTSVSRERAELFSLLASFDRECQHGWFSNRQNRDETSTHKLKVGVFTQPGSKPLLTSLKRDFRNSVSRHVSNVPIADIERWHSDSQPPGWKASNFQCIFAE